MRKRGREGEREAEKHLSVTPHILPNGDLARNPGMCPEGGSNQRPFGSQDNVQSTEVHQSGLLLLLLLLFFNKKGISFLVLSFFLHLNFCFHVTISSRTFQIWTKCFLILLSSCIIFYCMDNLFNQPPVDKH